MFQEESEFNKRAIAEQLRREESENIEKKLAFQNKAFRGQQTDVVDALKGNYVLIIPIGLFVLFRMRRTKISGALLFKIVRTKHFTDK